MPRREGGYFVDKFGAPAGGMAELAERERQARARRATDSSRVVPIYGPPIDLDLTDILISPDDVVYTGRLTNADK